MTTLQDARSFFEKVQRWDVQAGKWFGNADHVRKAGESWFSYSLAIAARVLLVGFSVAVLTVMLMVMAGTGDKTLWSVGLVGYGVLMLVIVRVLYPQFEGLESVVLFTILTATFMGLGASHAVWLEQYPAWIVVRFLIDVLVLQYGIPIILFCLLLDVIYRVVTHWLAIRFPKPKPARSESTTEGR